MKSRFLLVLPLAGLLAIPAIAQDNNQTQPTSQPAATQQQANPQSGATAQPSSTDQTSSTHQPLTYERHEGFWGKMNPFARKKYVQRQLTPIRDRMNELDELTARNAAQIRDVDQRATEGIKQADNRASLADQHAIDAGNKATQAQQTAQAADVKLTSVNNVVTNIDQFKPATQVEIKFKPGQAILSQHAKQALDDMAGNLKGQHGFIIEVQGFSSGRGLGAVQNSQKMADAVVRYLVINHDVPMYRIYTLGLGNTPVQASNTTGSKPRRTTGGRVEVSLLRNEGLAGMQSASGAAPSANPNDGQNVAPATGNTAMPQGDQNNAPATQAQPAQQTPQSAPAGPAPAPKSKDQTPPPTNPHQ